MVSVIFETCTEELTTKATELVDRVVFQCSVDCVSTLEILYGDYSMGLPNLIFKSMLVASSSRPITYHIDRIG